jgi:very-short-patch-repair endonuclease
MILTIENYLKLEPDQKKEYLTKALEEKSVTSLAEEMGTYPNKLRRDAEKFGINIRNRSETRKMLLDTNQAFSPTQGKERSFDERVRIGKARSESWTDEAKKRMAEISRGNWNAKSDKDKREFLRLARVGIKKALDYGSKLENEIYEFLIQNGYQAERQRKFLIERSRMSIDIFLNDHGVAIEIDGPSHQLPIWGEAKLIKTQQIDDMKTGLLISTGIRVIRIKFNKEVFLTDKLEIKTQLLEAIKSTDKLTIIRVHNE